MLSQSSGNMLTLAWALAGFVLLAGCATHPAQYAFRNDFSCQTGQSRVVRVQGSVFHVMGCQQQATYRCQRGRCVALHERRSRTPPRPRAPVAKAVQAVENGESYEVIKVDLAPDRDGFRVEAGAAPSRARSYVLVQFHLSGRKFGATAHGPCGLRLIVDLKPVELTGLSRMDFADRRVCSVKLPLDSADALVRSQHAVWGVFGGTWDVDDLGRERLADLLVRHRQALARLEALAPAL